MEPFETVFTVVSAPSPYAIISSRMPFFKHAPEFLHVLNTVHMVGTDNITGIKTGKNKGM